MFRRSALLLCLAMTAVACSGGGDDSGPAHPAMAVTSGSVVYEFAEVECTVEKVIGSRLQATGDATDVARAEARFGDQAAGEVWLIRENGVEDLVGSFDAPLDVDSDTGERSARLDGANGDLLLFNCPS